MTSYKMNEIRIDDRRSVIDIESFLEDHPEVVADYRLGGGFLAVYDTPSGGISVELHEGGSVCGSRTFLLVNDDDPSDFDGDVEYDGSYPEDVRFVRVKADEEGDE